MNAMMIDLETLSLRPDAFVLQAGICVANLDTGHILTPAYNVWLKSDGQEGRHIDRSTVGWWTSQDPMVANGVFNAQDPEYLWDSEKLFQHLTFMMVAKDVQTVWAGPGMFDLPVLTSLWQGRKPWNYGQERCFMTLRKALDPDNHYIPDPNEKAHDAAADAEWQMQWLMGIYANVLRPMDLASESHSPAVTPA